MGNTIPYKTVSFDDVIYVQNHPETWVIITTLPDSSKCLINSTCPIENEVDVLNDIIDKNKKMNIIIYGSSSNDQSVIKKYNQLLKLGFKSVYIYMGGLFEWLLLQDVYSNDMFGTTTQELDILKYKGDSITQNTHRIPS